MENNTMTAVETQTSTQSPVATRIEGFLLKNLKR